jgi:hypothetical protein
VAHVVAYETWRGAIPPSLELDHLCRFRACVNPAHLEAVTSSVNVARGHRFRVRQACKAGHRLSAENLMMVSSHGSTERRCRECSRASLRAWRAKKKVAKHLGNVDPEAIAAAAALVQAPTRYPDAGSVRSAREGRI